MDCENLSQLSWGWGHFLLLPCPQPLHLEEPLSVQAGSSSGAACFWGSPVASTLSTFLSEMLTAAPRVAAVTAAALAKGTPLPGPTPEIFRGLLPRTHTVPSSWSSRKPFVFQLLRVLLSKTLL